jgi:Concanavalin A-like lectin/glucanases superfamily/Domain of unknown function (DUF2341)
MTYLYRKALTVPHAQVSGGSDLLNFPLLLSLTDPQLATAAHGGYVQNSNGYDIIFTDIYNIQLDHEIERYVASTGEIEMWVRIPSLSVSADTVIFIYFGNSAITTSQANPTGVWDSNFNNVYHLGNGTTLSVTDSTSHGNLGTNNGATATAGQIDGGANFDGISQYITAPSAGLPTGATSWTASCWIKPSNNPASNKIMLYFGGSSPGMYLIVNAGHLKVFTGAMGTVDSGIVLTNGHVYFVIVSYDGSTMKLSVGDVSGGTFTTITLGTSITNALTADNLYIGNDPFSEFFPGWEDEVRISTGIARSAGWSQTEYNNQSSPGTFYSVGILQILQRAGVEGRQKARARVRG